MKNDKMDHPDYSLKVLGITDDPYVTLQLQDFTPSTQNHLIVSSADDSYGVGTLLCIPYKDIFQIRGNQDDGYEVIWVGDGEPGPTPIYDLNFIGNINEWAETHDVVLAINDYYRPHVNEEEVAEIRENYNNPQS